MASAFLECSLLVALLGILATLAIPGVSCRATQQLELDSGLRRLRVGHDQGDRMAAERDRQPCALHLCQISGDLLFRVDIKGTGGFIGKQPGSLDRRPPACLCGRCPALAETVQVKLELRSNLPDAVRFSSNGFGAGWPGLVVLSNRSIKPCPRHLCLVIGLPWASAAWDGAGVIKEAVSIFSSALCLPSD